MKINKVGTFMVITLFTLQIQFMCFAQQDINSEKDKKEYVSNEIIVKFKNEVSQKAKENIFKVLKVISSRTADGNHYHVLTIEEGEVLEMVEKCSKYSEIEYAEPNHMYYINAIPNDEFYSFQWHFSLIHLEEAWELSTGEGVTVAVVDTGVDPGGMDGFGSRLISGKNFIKRGKEPIDDNGHGTHIAGTIAQETNNDIGVAGVAPGANILVVKSFNEFGGSSADSVIDGIRWAINNGAHVINMSFGGSLFNETLKRVLNAALSRNIVLVAASGNNGQNTLPFPAAYEGVISVGAVRFDKSRPSYSNFGPKLDLVAPGGDVTKDQDDNKNADGVLQETLFTDILKSKNSIWNYYFLSGTSFASSHVAGVVALILSLNPELTPTEVTEILRNTAEDIDEPGRDDFTGWGLVNAANAVKAIK